MGEFSVRPIENMQDRAVVTRHILDDIETLDRMIIQGAIDKSHPKIGAEQEMCLIGSDALPVTQAMNILKSINDPHFTNELALFNMEINLDPLLLEKDCFSKLEESLNDLLKKGKEHSAHFDASILLTGILPTIKYRHLDFPFMTPIQRYQTISEVLLEIRKSNFEIYLQGVDDLMMSLGSVLFEACNTSYQLHLQLDPDNFAQQYNWAQMISGPVLATAVNSPILFGKELWAETRIALFKQSLDTRSSRNTMREKLSRVFFGTDWIKGLPGEIWKEQISRFPAMLTSDNFRHSSSLLEKGETPDLKAAALHNGTSYSWNRLCYGQGGAKPHLRIECRYLPSGPTVVDEIATSMFWIGLMSAIPENWVDLMGKQSFKATKNNFMKAARYGLDVSFNWLDDKIPAQTLILDKLLPIAVEGLERYSINGEDIKKYLGIIEARVRTGRNGADWIIRNYRRLQENYNDNASLKMLTAAMLEMQDSGKAVHNWDMIKSDYNFVQPEDSNYVEDHMTSDVFCLRENSNILLAKKIMQWKNIHHIPVENSEGELVGLITDGLIERNDVKGSTDDVVLEDIMLTDLVTVSARDSVRTAKKLMDENDLKGIPVIYQNKLVGILTLNDLKKNE